MVAYSFKERFIKPIQVGLGIYQGGPETALRAAWPAAKCQTIRAIGKRRHARPGEILQLYYGMRTRQCRSIGIAKCASVEGVYLKWSEWQSFNLFDVTELGGTYRRFGPLRTIIDTDQFARDDGFGHFAEMTEFWMNEHGAKSFEGLLIKWEPVS